MGISSRPKLTADLAPSHGLPQSGTISGLYNAEVGLARWRRRIPYAQKRSNGTGEGGVDVLFVWDSLGLMAAATARYDTIPSLVRNKLQARFNPSGVLGGAGTIMWRSADSGLSSNAQAWSAVSRMPFAASTTATGTNGTASIEVASTTGMVATGTVYFTTTATYRTIVSVDDATHFTASSAVTTTGGETVQMISPEGIGTYTGVWAPVSGISHSGAAPNRLRSTGTSAQASVVRMLFLNTDDWLKRSLLTSVDFLYGTEAVAGTLTVDAKITTTDAAITAGTGEVGYGTSTQDCNAASSGGNRKTLTLTAGNASSWLIQAAVTSGTGYPEGLICYNGDEDCGVRVHNLSRCGASSGDTWNAATLSATFTKFCAKTTRATQGALVVMNFMTNDIAAGRSIADFKTNMATILDNIGVTNDMCVLYVIPILSNSAYISTSPSWEEYRTAIYELAAARTSFMAVLDMYEFQGSPTVTTAFEAAPTLWVNTSASRHYTDLGIGAFSECIYAALTEGI